MAADQNQVIQNQAIHVIGGGLAGCEAAWQIAARGVPVVLHEMRPVAHDRGAQDRRARRARLLELVSLRRPGAQRRRPPARGDAPARLAGHAGGRPEPGTGGRRARGRPRRLFGGRHGGARGPSADRHPPRGDGRPAAGGLGQRHRRHRPADLAGARRGDRAADRRGRARLLRRHRADRAPRHRSTCRSPGCSRATTRRARAARAPTTSTVRSRASNTRPSSTRSSPATRSPSTTGKRRRPISTAACRSRSWPSAGARRCATAR